MTGGAPPPSEDGPDEESPPPAGERPSEPGSQAAPDAGGRSPAAPGDSAPPFLGPRRRIALGAFFAVLYAVSFIARGEIAAGLVGAVLGGVLVYLILKEADERRRRRWRATRPGPRP